MELFVTGGSGFIGEHLIRILRFRGDPVRGLALTNDDADIIRQAGAEPIPGDLDQTDVLINSMRGCDTVVHLAAIMKLGGDYSALHPVNVAGTQNMIAAARAAGIKRFIYISAAAVLSGGRPIIDADETWQIPETPVGAYAQTKAEGEKIVLAANSDAFHTLVIRPPCVWGAGDKAMLPTITRAARQGRWRWVDKGEYLYSVCHVKNVCEGIILACEKGRSGAVYFLTDGPPLKFRDFFSALIQTQGISAGTKSIPRWLANGMAPLVEIFWRLFRLHGEPPLSREIMAFFFNPVWINDHKARTELGYAGYITTNEGLAELRRLTVRRR